MPDILLVNPNDPERLQLAEAIQNYPSARILAQARSATEALALLGTTRPQILICRSHLGDMSGLDFVAKAQLANPALHIILTLIGDEPTETWQRILELGIRNVITPPLDTHSVHRALTLATQTAQKIPAQLKPEPARDSYIVAVTAARGGVGKSLIAINLAHLLAKWSDAVLLLDYSGRPNDFTVMLDDVPRNTLGDLLTSGEALDTDYLQTLLANHPGGFRYLASPPQGLEAAEFTKPLARDILLHARQLADYILVDTNEPNHPVTQPALLESNLIFLITTRDIVRLLATQRFLVTLKDWGVDTSKVKILVNQAEIGSEISDSEIESILEHSVAAYLPSNPGPATFSINSGKALCVHDAKQPLAVVLNKLAELTWARWDKTAGNPTERPSNRGTSRFRSFLNRK